MFDGQSLNNYPLTGNSTWMAQVMAGRGVAWSNVSVSGFSWSALVPSASARRDPVLGHTSRCVLVLNGGTSDLLVDHDTAAVALADMEAYADAARAAAPGSLRVVACTIPPSTALSAPDEAQRLVLNPLILASDHWDAVVDLAAVPELADPADTDFYSDGTHWTAAGAAAAAGALDPVLTSQLAVLALA